MSDLRIVFPLGQKYNVEIFGNRFCEKDCYVFFNTPLEMKPSWDDSEIQYKEIETINSGLRKIEHQQEQIDILLKTVEFYADLKNELSPYEHHDPDRARQALKEYNKLTSN